MERHMTLSVVGAIVLPLVVLAVGCRPEAQGEAAGEERLAVSRSMSGAQTRPTSVPAGPYRVSGPYQHDNLAIYLIHGEDAQPGAAFLTLDEALGKGLLVLHETGDVQNLAIDNRSKTHSVYIQSGEMVSGGKQDRVLGVDLLLPPGAKGVTIPSYCVERGRWSARGGESTVVFRSNYNYVRQLTRANIPEVGNIPATQGRVWAKARTLQQAEIGNVPRMRLPAHSASSLDLTHEQPELKKAVQRYTDKLGGIVDGRVDAIGFACAFNGKLDGADVYASRELFRKLWPKLLEGTVIDAIARLQKGKTFQPPTLAKAAAWLAERREGKALQRTATERLGKNLVLKVRETKRDVILDTVAEDEETVIHRTYWAK